ncbi:MAG TPA: hypothetical protein VMV94_17270 [Phycisphaerae bacterium]|nr:hypothetical protein [Phycisphaerae bacterium]
MAALAGIASAAFFAQIFSRQGMLAAAMRSDYESLANAGKGGVRRSGAVTLNDLFAARDAAYRSHPKAAPHAAVARLLFELPAIQGGETDPAAAMAEVPQAEAADHDNLVARLAYAAIADLAAEEDAKRGGKTLSAAERFAAIRAIVDAAPPARLATLYNAELTEAWHDVVERFVRRPDVAITMAATLSHYEITDQYAALPIIQRRLAALANDLRREGQTADADHCTRWIARLTLGLIDADPDAGTRLLCADLLARSLDAQSPAARSLRNLQSDFMAAAASAPIDICDQAWSPPRAIAPSAYKWAFYSLIFASVLALIAVGGGILFGVSCVAAVVGSIARGSQAAAVSMKRYPVHLRLLGALLPPIAIASLLVGYLNWYGIYSQNWGLATGMCVIAAGSLLAIALANLHVASGTKHARLRIALVVVAMLVGILLTVTPPPVVTRICRQLDLAVGVLWILLLGLTVLVVAAIAICPARFRAIAAAAAMVWCLNACLALAVLQFHRSADARYQRAVVAARLDELPARLGSDWKQKYLKPALDAYDISKP